jgi:hypothetical protein
MLNAECSRELHESWLPHITDAGLERLIDLLEKDSPLLVHGCFTRAVPMGCLASHIAWHHPRTTFTTIEAGIYWLHHIAGLNPATSRVIRAWDTCGNKYKNWELRTDLLNAFIAERERRLRSTSIQMTCETFLLPAAAI